MTTIYEVSLQLWIGSTDVNGMLRDVGGWRVGSFTARENSLALEYATKRGWIQTRMHHYPDKSPAVPAYELTDAGLEQLRRSWGPDVASQAKYSRAWYRLKAYLYGRVA